MRKSLSVILAGILFMLSGCGSVPITGRKQMLLVSDQEMLGLSLQQYDAFMQAAQKSTDMTNTALVVKVGKNIAMAVETFLSNNGYKSELANFAWEFNLVKSDEVNAFCMPGGKIVVYEGILPYTQNETGLAVVLGHEVAHAVAKHSNERASQSLLTEFGSGMVSAAISSKSETTQQIVAAAVGLGSQYFITLPFSRNQELEADKLGLVFMSMAGYDPRQAEGFWMRMAQKGTSTPEFMSTHPSDEHRIQDIQKYLPEALKYYKSAGGAVSSAKTSSKWTF
jgi:predicted Zn-dependent protease